MPGARDAGETGIENGASRLNAGPLSTWKVRLSPSPGRSLSLRPWACSVAGPLPGLKTWLPNAGMVNLAGSSAGALGPADAEASGVGATAAPDVGARAPTPICFAVTTMDGMVFGAVLGNLGSGPPVIVTVI